MVVALKELSIRGEIRTTIEYLPKVLEHPDFIKNNVSTTWYVHVPSFFSNCFTSYLHVDR